jgi:N-acetylglucosamine-6-sulfatase
MESLIQDVMKLALQVNIMEGTMDAAIKSRLPGARYSLPGQEVETFPATFSNFDNNATQQASNHTVSSETQTTPSSVSMVAMSMYASHSMRHCGVGLLLATLLVWGLLLRAAKRRRHLHFERDHFSLNSWNICREEDAIPDHVKLNYNRTVKQRKNSGAGRYNSSAGLFIVLTLVPLVTCTDESSRRMPPNFVIVLTDDLDWTLGGANASTLRRTRKLIAEQGKTFSNWFVQTPVCCPSRAELLTGQLFHNLKLTENTSPGCMHVNVSNDAAHPFYSRNYFAPYFSHNKTLQYNVGVFGKHLNSYNPSDFMLPGVDEMLINGGGMYLDPTFTFGRGNDESVQSIHFNTCTNFTGMPCYSTSVIGNVSLGWIERHVKGPKKQQPFMTLISVKAPHILDGDGFPLSTPAPWYENTSISETTAPRTPNYNYSGYPDHHWLVRSQGPLTQEEGERIDALYVSRLKTLISVDDLVEELIHKLEQWNVLNNTYIFFTSDNGYRLGQFRMPMCKLHPYENDIRVPMMIRGPGIEKNSTSSLVSTHVNLMPTLMGLATGHHHSQDVVPATMDGTNLAASIIDHAGTNPVEQSNYGDSSEMSQVSSVLVEYLSLGSVVRYNHLVDTYNHSFVCLRILEIVPAPYPLRNIKYIEFRDIQKDWNYTGHPLEREFYDLDADPFEMHNIVSIVPSVLVEALSEKIRRMLQCKGWTCRKEHATGVEPFYESTMYVLQRTDN